MLDPITDPEILAGYLTDASNVSGHAEGLFRPRTTAEVAEVVANAQARGIPLTITAARTSTTASPVPFGGWLLSIEHLNQIAHIGHDTATAGPAVLLGELQAQIEASGRFFPPDPTSRHDCTLGAAIACNASGARSFKYGPTRPWVVALEVVLPDGSIRTLRRGDPVPSDWPALTWSPPAHLKSAAGYERPTDVVDVFIGSEGTLGVITSCEVRLTDLPADVLGVLAFFPDVPTALAFVRTARDAARLNPGGDLSPRCLEYLDHHCLDLARARGADVPDGAVAALFCEQEVAHDGDPDAHMAAWWEALEDGGALADDTILATDDPSRERLHALRHAVPAGINEEVVRNGMPKIGTDLAVPDDALEAIMEAYAQAPMRHVLFGHVGDNHLHLNLLPTTPEELTQAKAFYDTLAKRAIALGGTVSAEHGVGKLKAKQFAWMVPQAHRAAMTRLKQHLDPAWILGRGTLLPAPDMLAASDR